MKHTGKSGRSIRALFDSELGSFDLEQNPLILALAVHPKLCDSGLDKAA